jgi:hypothetical protein
MFLKYNIMSEFKYGTIRKKCGRERGRETAPLKVDGNEKRGGSGRRQ